MIRKKVKFAEENLLTTKISSKSYKNKIKDKVPIKNEENTVKILKMDNFRACTDINDLIKRCIFENYVETPETLDVSEEVTAFALVNAELESVRWTKEYATSFELIKDVATKLLNENQVYDLVNKGGPYEGLSVYGINGWINPITGKWEWFEGYPRVFSAKLAKFCGDVVRTMITELSEKNVPIPEGNITSKRHETITLFWQHILTGPEIVTTNTIGVELEKLNKMAIKSYNTSLKENTMGVVDDTNRRALGAASNAEDMLIALKDTKTITPSLLVSFVQLMTGTANAVNIENWSKLFEYQGFDALKFSQQIFMEIYWSKCNVPKADQNEEWLRTHMTMANTKPVLKDIVKLILLFFIRGTSVIQFPSKNMKEAGTTFILKQKQLLNIQQKIGTNIDQPGKMVVTLPRICSAFPGQSLMILKVNGAKIQRPVTDNMLLMHCLPDLPKPWTSSVVFSALPYPCVAELENFGKVLKTLLAYSFLESEIINQKNKSYKAKTFEQKWTLIDTYSRAAFNSTITNKADREHLFLKYCMPMPIPNTSRSLINRGSALYDKMTPFAVSNEGLAKTYSLILSRTQNCYLSPLFD